MCSVSISWSYVGGDVANIHIGSVSARGHGTVASDVSNVGLSNLGSLEVVVALTLLLPGTLLAPLEATMILSALCHCRLTQGVPELISITLTILL